MNEDIVPHDQFVAQMQADKQKNYVKGAIALVAVAFMLGFLALATSQLAGQEDFVADEKQRQELNASEK